jgi:aspartyl-tRNA(Asn)/glutamyl-tRNA(Gln) amidotransferase subunit A
MTHASDIADSVNRGESTALQHVESALTRLGTTTALNAVLATSPEASLRIAHDVDARRAAGQRLPLAGVPILIKDNIATGPDLHTPRDARGFGTTTTCGSRFLENYHSPFSASAVSKLLHAGAVPIAKTNLDEFGMGSSGENSAFGATRNPWDTSRVPGGSSSGSAAGVAAGLAPIALGSDTGGSIRQPASFCGLVGIKPTYGRVSRWGLVAYASSLDQIGPMARSVRDAALCLEVMSGADPLDATSALVQPPRLVDPLDTLDAPVQGLRIGMPRQARSEANHASVAAALDTAASTLRAQNATIVDIDLPHTDAGIAAYYIIATAEASSNLARFDGVRFGRRAQLTSSDALDTLYAKSRAEGFGAEVKRRIMLGTHVLSSGYYDAYYASAQKVRRLILQDYENAWASCDALLMPTAPSPAFAIGEKSSDPLAMYLEDVYTVGINLAGLPAVSVPAGFASSPAGRRLPVGVQLVGRAFDEATILRLARTIERSLGLDLSPDA